MNRIAVIEAGDLRLRPGSIDDVTMALKWYSDPEVLRNSEAVSEPYDYATVSRMYRYLMDNGEFYIIEVWTNNKWLAIGDACLMKDSTPIVIGNGNHRSKGVGYRVLSLLIKRAESLGWKEMNAKGIYTYNERSLRLFSSLGFKETQKREREDGIMEISLKLRLEH